MDNFVYKLSREHLIPFSNYVFGICSGRRQEAERILGSGLTGLLHSKGCIQLIKEWRRKRQLLCLPWPLVLDFKGAGSLEFANCLTWKDCKHSSSRNLAIILICAAMQLPLWGSKHKELSVFFFFLTNKSRSCEIGKNFSV